VKGILSYGAYVPFHRLDRQEVGQALGVPAGKGTRAVASYDEDTTTLAVEAGREALRARPEISAEALYLATASPAYQDKTNATAVHAALGCDGAAPAFDMTGAVRSGVGALRAALDGSRPVLVVLSDLRTGLPGSADERDGGDAAAAFLCGDDSAAPLLASHIGSASATAEFLDRWRAPGDPTSRVWEERFGEHVYLPLAEAALTEALKTSGLTPDALDHLIVTGTHTRAVRRAAGAAGARPEAAVDDLAAVIGNSGTAHPGLLLASVLDRADPGAVIALVVLADGADVLLFRTTDALAGVRAVRTVAAQAAAGTTVGYQRYLTWRGLLPREPPRRPDPTPPAAPPAARAEEWKFAFMAARCSACGNRNLPPTRVCRSCQAVDRMTPEPVADVPATVATFTLDRLAYSLNPPVVVGVIDFDGGGRFQCELTDVQPETVRIGDRVEMTFRRISSVNGIHNYFWKARPRR
jgi:hydroxymethylglutaryl-CoA synthase